MRGRAFWAARMLIVRVLGGGRGYRRARYYYGATYPLLAVRWREGLAIRHVGEHDMTFLHARSRFTAPLDLCRINGSSATRYTSSGERTSLLLFFTAFLRGFASSPSLRFEPNADGRPGIIGWVLYVPKCS